VVFIVLTFLDIQINQLSHLLEAAAREGDSKNRHALPRPPDRLPPMRMSVDVTGIDASNEIAINWNATLVFVLAGMLN
jgi:hypothetical protein